MLASVCRNVCRNLICVTNIFWYNNKSTEITYLSICELVAIPKIKNKPWTEASVTLFSRYLNKVIHIMLNGPSIFYRKQ